MISTSVSSILSLNANGIRNRKLEFFDFMLQKQIGLACLCETKLNDSIRFSHSDFRVFRFDCEGGEISHGGFAIVAHTSLSCKLLPSLNLEIVECIGVRMKLEGTLGYIDIYSVYYTGTTGDQNHDALRRDLRTMANQRNAIYLGDLNAKHSYWGCLRANTAGNILYDEMCSNRFDVLFPDEPTYHPGAPRLPSTLDIAIKTSDAVVTSVITEDDLGSDHLPILLELDVYTKAAEPDLTLCYSKANWARFQAYLNRNINLLEFQFDENITTSDIDDRVSKLTELIKEATNLSVPRRHRYSQSPQMTLELDALIKLRRSKKKLYSRTGALIYKQEYQLLNARIKFLSTQIENSNFQRYISEFEPGKDHNKGLFAMAKLLKGRTKHLPPLKEQNKVLISDFEKAEALASRFRTNHLITADSPASSHIEDAINNSTNEVDLRTDLNTDLHTFATTKEVRNVIKRLNNNKAPGVDGIKNITIKNSGRKCITALTYIINACLMLSYFPVQWKSAITIPIRKPGKPSSSTESYRPISLLPTLSKILERIIRFRIKQHTENNNIVPDTQFGFRPASSATHQIHRVVKDVRTGFEKEQSTGLVLLDLTCAFDSVWHDALIYKMCQNDFPMYLIKLVRSFLNDRSFHVKVGHNVSTQRSIPAGLPQGATLSPDLFNLFTYDIPPDHNVSIGQFADDIAIWRSARRAACIKKPLQDASDRLTQYLHTWRLKQNARKTVAMFFTRRRSRRAFPRNNLVVSGQSIQWSDCAKYLGVMLDRKLTFRPHIEFLTTKAGNLTRLLYPLLSRSSLLHQHNKRLLIKSTMIPSIAHASPVWTPRLARCHMQKLQVIQNRWLKMCYDLPPRYPTVTLHQKAQMEQFAEHVTRLRLQYEERIQSSTLPMIRTLLESSMATSLLDISPSHPSQ